MRALAHAERGDLPEAARSLLQAADWVASTPARFLDHDVLIGCAALAYRAGDHLRCSRLLGAVGGKVRSPASFRLYLHYQGLVEEDAGDTVGHLEATPEDEPASLLEEELHQLRIGIDELSDSETAMRGA